jgi:hypothetical protein
MNRSMPNLEAADATGIRFFGGAAVGAGVSSGFAGADPMHTRR